MPAKVAELIHQRVALVSGRAMAAVLLNKPEADVTDAEAVTAHVEHVREHDLEKQARALRAAWRAAAHALEAEGVLPGILGPHLTLALSDLDRGEASGMAKPAPRRRSRKKAARADQVRTLAILVHQTMGRFNISKAHALVAVTGLSAGAEGREYEKVMEPVAGFWTGQTHDAIRKQLTEGEKELGRTALAELRAMGEAARASHA